MNDIALVAFVPRSHAMLPRKNTLNDEENSNWPKFLNHYSNKIAIFFCIRIFCCCLVIVRSRLLFRLFFLLWIRPLLIHGFIRWSGTFSVEGFYGIFWPLLPFCVSFQAKFKQGEKVDSSHLSSHHRTNRPYTSNVRIIILDEEYMCLKPSIDQTI